VIPTRWVGEQHVKDDLRFIPSFADWMRAIRPLPWMGRAGRIEDRPAPERRQGLDTLLETEEILDASFRTP
jgi:hypothetical protein